MRITPTIIFIFFALYILECELRQLVTVFDDSSCTKLIGFYYHVISLIRKLIISFIIILIRDIIQPPTTSHPAQQHPLRASISPLCLMSQSQTILVFLFTEHLLITLVVQSLHLKLRSAVRQKFHLTTSH